MSEVCITDPVTGAQKGQKQERFDLLPWDALEEVARVYGFGATKYEDWNWLKGYRWSLSFGALVRHVARAILGEDRDPESGCLHLAHAAWHCLTLITFLMRGLGMDDRKVPPDVAAAPLEKEFQEKVMPTYRILYGQNIDKTAPSIEESDVAVLLDLGTCHAWYRRTEVEPC